MCLCLFASTNTNMHTRTCCGETHPSVVPHLEKPQNQTQASLFQLPFFPPPSPHQIYLNSPTVSFFPPLSLSFALISNVSMCPHKHAPTLSHTPQSGNHNKHIKALKDLIYDS